MLQEAEANMLRGIPSMEVAVEGGTMPPSATEGRVEKPKLSAPSTQGQRSSYKYSYLQSCSHHNTLSGQTKKQFFFY